MIAFALRIGTSRVTGQADGVNSFVRLHSDRYDLTAVRGPGMVKSEMTNSAHTPVPCASIISVVIFILPL